MKWKIVSMGQPRLDPSAHPRSKVLRAAVIKSVAGVNIMNIPDTANHVHERGRLYADKYGNYNAIRVRNDVTINDFIWQKG